MAHFGSDKPIEQPLPATGLSPDRAATLATENQGAPGSKVAADKVNPFAGLDGLIVPPLEIYGVNGGKDQINDCSKDKCVVNGKQYQDSTDIPGNRPKPLLHQNGKPVLGPDGEPVFGPDRVDLDKVAAYAREHNGPLGLANALLNFAHNGDWDFQRMKTDDGQPIFTQKYQNFANISIGYILGAMGVSLDKMSSYADTYCQFKCHYNEPMSPQYPHLADRQVRDFQIGLDLYKERHPNGK